VIHRLHADTVSVPTPGVDGERYFLTLLDEHSNFACSIPVSSKTSVVANLIDEIRRWERDTGCKVHTIRTDRGTEFMNKTFHAFCAENGIHTEYSAAYTPEQYGRAERMNRTVIEKARTLLLGVEADEELWVEAVLTAVHLHNLMPVTGKNKTPFELFHGSSPDVSYLRKWGCLAYVKHPKHQTSKFGSQSEPGMFVGYCPHTKGYRVRLRDRVVVTPHVHFVEEESGAATLNLLKQSVPKEVGTESVHGEAVREDMVYREEVVQSEGSDLEEGHHTPLDGSPGPVPQASLEDSATSTATHDTTAQEPAQGPAHQDLTRMMARLQLAARNGGTATSNVSGTRMRAHGTVRHLNGAPVPTTTDHPEPMDRLQPYCPLTRAQRLEQRNARKEVL
jgi:transposase InsO family protein